MEQIDGALALDIVSLFGRMGRQQARWQEEKGWAEEGDRLRAKTHDPAATLEQLDHRREFLRNYYIAKLALITTEVAEAIEEIRQNRTLGETVYSFYDGDTRSSQTGPDGEIGKPEGVLSELADVVIRIWSLTGEAGLANSLGQVIVEKLNYNATRELRHGGKAI